MTHVWVVLHEYTLPGDRDEVKMIGVYTSEQSAQRAVERMRAAPGFRDTPDGFAIDRYKLDEDNWVEGFVTVWHG